LVHGAISDGNALYKADDIFKALEDAPTADVVEVRHGRWGNGEKGAYRKTVCSRCGTTAPYEKIKRGYHIMWRSNYCPNCGAKMDGRGDTDGE
jgi:PHP family Zn ribbon phosphoesterase